MANSKLEVANKALQLLGERAVQDISELPATPSGAAIYRHYDEVVEERMRAYAWSFLTQSEDAVQIRADSPYSGAWVVYRTPNNILRVVSVLFKNSPNRAAEYRIDQDGIHAPAGGYLTVVFMRARAEADWSPEFSRYIQSALALAAAGTVKADYVIAMTEDVQRRYENARTTDIKASRGNQLQAFDADGILRAVGGGGSHRRGVFGGGASGDYYRGGYFPS